jgi:cation diffusion facilitator CzcD-associated flavoprotein CzcO
MTAAEPATETDDGTGATGPAFPAGRHLRVAVIGAGFAGLAVAHRLRSVGIEDFVVLERGRTVGGTWRENTYPGCGCDIPSHLYSFSFAPNPSWSRSFSRQPEILRYLEGVTRRLDLERHVVLDTDVTSSRWEDDAARWRVTTSRGELTADVLVGATGPLTEPRLPLVPGLAEFEGPVFHSARWRHDVDLTGKRVAVVGTGASAIQIVPRLQPVVDRLVLFQRTPPWVIPKIDRRSRASSTPSTGGAGAQRAAPGVPVYVPRVRVPASCSAAADGRRRARALRHMHKERSRPGAAGQGSRRLPHRLQADPAVERLLPGAA